MDAPLDRRAMLALTAFAAQAAAQQKPLVGIGSLMHESNSFNSDKTGVADFQSLEMPGEAPLDTWAKTMSEVSGFVLGGRAAGFELYPTINAAATPKGPVTDEAFEKYTSLLISRFKAAPRKLDGILLALHGAMVSESYPQADEEIMRRMRAAFPATPIVLTHDFHGNISEEIVRLSTVLLTYKQTPHIDTRDRGLQAASIMDRILKGEVKPVQAIVKPPMVYNIIYQNTNAKPYLPLTQASIDLEKNPKVLAASVAGGYQYGDVPWMGPSIIVVTDNDAALARREAQRISDMMWAQRDYLVLNIPGPEAAVKEAMAAKEFPVSLFDTGDNVGGGSSADATFVLDQLLKQKATGWVYTVYDPAAVEAAKRAGVGGRFEMAVGGKTDKQHGEPVTVRGTVRTLNTGSWIEPEARHGGRRYWSQGHAAVIEAEGSTPDLQNLLILTTERVMPFSLRQLSSLGIDASMQRILVAKGTVAPRAAYEPVSKKIILVDSPGSTAINPARFTFTRVRAKLFGM